MLFWRRLARNFVSTIKAIITWKSVRIGVILVRIFPHLNWIRRDAEYLSVFSPNAGKYGPKKLQIRIHFTQWMLANNVSDNSDNSKVKKYCYISVMIDMTCLKQNLLVLWESPVYHDGNLAILSIICTYIILCVCVCMYT